MKLLSRFWLRGLPDDFRAFALRQVSTRDGNILSALATVLMAGILALALWQTNPNMQIWVWLNAVFVLSGVGFILRSKKTFGAAFVIEICIGLLWLIAALAFYPAAPDGLQIFFALVVLGAALSIAVFQSGFLPGAIAAIGLAIPAIAVRIVLQQDGEPIFLPVFAMAGWLGALGLAWFLYKAFLSRTILLFEKTSLLQSVEDKVAELDQLRKMEQKARKEADAANAAKSRFLAHASHDLRQPLHAVGLLLATVPEKGQNKQTKLALDRIGNSLDVLSDLFDSLLDVALLDTGRVDVNISVFPIGDVLVQVVQDFKDVAKRNGIHLRACPTTQMVRSDPVIIRRMVQNLVSNAIAHAHNSRVLIGVRRHGDTLGIEVHDTGEGIAPSDQKRIFEEFTKVGDRKSRNDMPGLGLGLAIVQRLANIIGARITLASTIGKGSVFAIENLERVNNAEHIPVQPIIKKQVTEAQKARIAIIDDEMDILRVTEKLVKKWGFTADCYTHYDAAAFRKPDIVLCDFELMQELNGIEIVASIREQFNQKIPAIVISGNNSEQLIKLAKRNSLPLLFKPVRPAQLRSVLLTALSDD